MTTNNHLYSLAITLLDGIGSRRAKHLISHLGSAEAVFKENKRLLAKTPFIGEISVRNLNREAALSRAEQYLDYLEKHDHQVFYFQDENYPNRLKSIDDAPILLYGFGNLHLNEQRVVSVVGTRKMTNYGKSICEELVHGLKSVGVTVVSGLALGIDGEIHKNCVQNDLQTIGVLGHGLDRMYPALHRKLANQMLENGGVLTEFLPGTLPDKENFPMRNRIVAGMSDATIVVESGIKGGSLITCELANDYNKEVFAYPGSIYAENSMGCNKLIAQNKGHLVTSSHDILKMMEWEIGQQKQMKLDWLENVDEDQKTTLMILKEKGMVSIDALVALTGFTLGKLSSLLLTLECSGIVQSLPAKRYKISSMY